MDVRYMREFVSNSYGGEKWKRKVSKMQDNQVIAIYHSIIARNNRIQKEDIPHVKQNEVVKEEIKKEPEPHQITMFEYLHSLNEGK